MGRELYNKFGEYLKSMGLEHIFNSTRRLSPDGCYYFCEVASFRNPKNILEIGTHKGHTAALLAFLFKDANITTIDPDRASEIDEVIKIFPNITYIQTTSENLPKNVLFDLVFIDGCHTFEWVKKDWDNIQNLTSNKTIVIFDDVDYIEKPDINPGTAMVLKTITNAFVKIFKIDEMPILGIVTNIKGINNGSK